MCQWQINVRMICLTVVGFSIFSQRHTRWHGSGRFMYEYRHRNKCHEIYRTARGFAKIFTIIPPKQHFFFRRAEGRSAQHKKSVWIFYLCEILQTRGKHHHGGASHCRAIFLYREFTTKWEASIRSRRSHQSYPSRARVLLYHTCHIGPMYQRTYSVETFCGCRKVKCRCFCGAGTYIKIWHLLYKVRACVEYKHGTESTCWVRVLNNT